MIERNFMSGRKYDYSNELAQDVPQSENEERKAEARTRWLEERSIALADEFRDLKPEIGRAYNFLQKLVSQTSHSPPPCLTCMTCSKPIYRSVFRKRTGRCRMS